MPVDYVQDGGADDRGGGGGDVVGLFASSFTQMVLRLTNRSGRTVTLSDVVLQVCERGCAAALHLASQSPLLSVAHAAWALMIDHSAQYWFDAPEPGFLDSAAAPSSSASGGAATGALPAPRSSDPAVSSSLQALQFKMYCSDASADLPGGCGALQATFSSGLPGVHGAQ